MNIQMSLRSENSLTRFYSIAVHFVAVGEWSR